MLIDIDDALLARYNELMTELIELRKSDEDRERELEGWREVESIKVKIIDITTIAYFKRGDNEKENT